MKIIYGEVVANKKYGENLFKIEIFSPYICRNAVPGQFVNIKCSDSTGTDPFLRRPFSIYETDKNFNVFSVFFVVKGKGTFYLSKKEKGDIIDLIGPLGNGFVPGDLIKNFALIGGGIGVAPLHMIASEMLGEGKSVTFIAGFKDETFYHWQKDINKLSKDCYLFTENGSFGIKGTPLNYIKTNMSVLTGKQVVLCGPKLMLAGFQELFKGSDVDAIALIEEQMACGIGACLGCVIKVRVDKNNFEYKKVCSDGPVFKLMEVCFD
jgi:dihydroorotate dehydrogenase electron transfer subunit